jgi:hypothetical protein
LIVPEREPDFRKDTRFLAWRVFGFFCAQAYFWYWSWRKDKTRYFRYAALSVLSLSTILLVLEVALELVGPEKLTPRVSRFLLAAHHHKIPAALVLGICVAALLYMIAYHYHEARKPDYEFNFTMRLYECIDSQRILTGEEAKQKIKKALELIYFVFRESGAKHVCLHTFENDELIIRPENVFPETTDPEYSLSLRPGQGVAGKVYADSFVRYVPRLKLLWMAFPHAVNFAYRPLDRELVEREADYFLFQPNARFSPRFKSVLSVPVRAPGSEKSSAVLSIDFGRNDPIDKWDIAMATVFGMILSDKLV